MKETVLEKLKVLAESAKYDVSCASSGVTRRHRAGGVGSTAGWGICHSFTADGRCVSLLKIMLTNVCIYDCAYCINRRSNDIRRAAFTPDELTELTIEFYRRNYIEGLFLSSGVVRTRHGVPAKSYGAYIRGFRCQPCDLRQTCLFDSFSRLHRHTHT